MSKEKQKLEDTAPDLVQDAGLGLEGLNAGNMALPFISILQPLSPQVLEENPKYILGARPGMLFNTVTGEIFDTKKKPLIFIVAGFKQAWPEWKDRESGQGGFVKMHATSEILGQTKPNAKNKPALSNGNIIVDTAYYFGLILREDGVTEHAVISMSSSQWKVARTWNALLSRDLLDNGMVAPAFRCKWALNTVSETKGNNSWFMWKVLKVGPVTEVKTIEVSRGFAQQVKQNALLLANKSSATSSEDDGAGPY